MRLGAHKTTSIMKKDIHPAYYPESKVTCVCGNSFTIGSTLPELKIEICSACHPFYTGKQKLIDTARRVEKFQAKSVNKAALADRKGKKAKRAAKAAKKEKKEVTVKIKPSDLAEDNKK